MHQYSISTSIRVDGRVGSWIIKTISLGLDLFALSGVHCSRIFRFFSNADRYRQYTVKFKIIDSVRWLLCPHCGKQFKKPLDLVRHLRIHNSIKPFKVSDRLFNENTSQKVEKEPNRIKII